MRTIIPIWNILFLAMHTVSVSAAASDAPESSLDNICAVNHERATLMCLESHKYGERELQLNMDIGEGTFVFEQIILKENSLHIDGQCILDKISLFVAGGSPEVISTENKILSYREPIRFFAASARYTHHKKLTALMKKMSDEDILTQELHALKPIQTQPTLKDAAEKLHTLHPFTPMLIIDLAAWLSYCQGPDWRTALAVKREVTKQLPFPLCWFWQKDMFTDL